MKSLPTSRKIVTKLWLCVTALLSCALFTAPGALATPSTSATHFYISGGGFGHGIGMSQYGAAGYALHGYTYQQILSHYYSTTTLGSVNPNQTVTVLLHEGAATFRGAIDVRGVSLQLSPSVNYGVIVEGSRLALISRGRTILTVRPPLVVRGSGPLTLVGQGRYRGSFVFRPISTGGVMTINSVGLDDYVRGVVSAEMPASWPVQALEAQAVAARTYALTAGAVAADFQVYDDTRSQMYEGVKAETPTTNAAVAATRGQVVDYDGSPAVTYFFASSGGYTESIQNVWAGVTPEAWLHGVADPYDDSYNNPYYRWTDRFTVANAARRLSGLYKGTFEGVNITQTGVSPRVVSAQVVGSGGVTTITGAQLEQKFGTLSTYMNFTTLTETGTQSSTPVQASTGPAPTQTTTTPITTTPTTTTPTTTTTTSTTPSGGVGIAAAAAEVGSSAAVSSSNTSIQGSVYPAQPGATVVAQLNEAGRWTAVSQAQVTTTGTYTIPVSSSGLYRVAIGSITGPNITVP
jgi:stage II sporulation protein D